MNDKRTMKSHLHMLARTRLSGVRAPLIVSLLTLPWAGPAPAQNVLGLCQDMEVASDPGLAPVPEPLATQSSESQSPYTFPPKHGDSGSDLRLDSGPESIWQDGVGQGFRPTTHTFSVEAGVGVGMASFGSRQAHDLGLTSLSYGHMLGPVVGEGHWYRGNFEWRVEVFGGFQYHPDVNTDGWLIGLTPHLRYNFATGTRWIPFIDAGAGVTATGIAHPDLGGTFEFNLQPGVGMHWFVRDNLALTGEVKYMHLSCAGIDKPNLGVNDIIGLIGLTWFF